MIQLLKKSSGKKQAKQHEAQNQPAKSSRLDKNAPGLLELVIPDCLHLEKDYIYLGSERYARVYVLAVHPYEINIGFFNSFFNLGQISISIYVEPADTGEVIVDLTKKITKLKSNEIVSMQRGKKPDYRKMTQAEDYEMLRAALQRGIEKALYVQVFFTIFAESLEKLKEKCEEFESRCAAYNIKPRCLSFEQFEGLLTTLPLGNQKYSEHQRTYTTGSAASTVPVGNTDVYYEGGVFLGYNLLTGAPVFYNQFAPELTGPHMAIFGTVGSGKSTTMKTMLARAAAFGFSACVLDPEGEYEKLINMLGGKYVKVKSGEKIGLNPFELEVEEDEGKRFVDIDSKISEIRFILGIISENFIGKKLDGIQLAIIERAVRKLYADRGIDKSPESLYTSFATDSQGRFYIGKVKKRLPTLSDLREELLKEQETQQLAKAMEVFTGDGTLALFDCESQIDLQEGDRIIGFNLKEFDKDPFLKFFAAVNILNWIWNKFSHAKMRQQKKVVIFDEAWMFTKYESTNDYLESLSRRGRKYKISLLIASQTILEFLNTTAGRTMLNMCATKFIFKQEADLAQETAEYFKLSDAAKNFLMTAEKGQGILVNSKEKVLLQVTPFAFEWDYVTTTNF